MKSLNSKTVINVLSDEIVNQIAAGEVIENPSAVVKELVENSIDSGADFIEVEIEQSGLKKIVISDNGCGISKEDLLLAPKRHATSKIKDFNDLYNISTMGFRGEALASIFSVAKSRIVSRLEGSDGGFEINSENVDEVYDAGGGVGTSVEVCELFYNTPARKKYLRSERLELKSIVDIFERFCVYYHNVKLVLKSDGKVLVNKPKFKTAEENLYYVLGRNLKGNLMKVESEQNGIKLTGFIAKPSEITYSYIKNQFLFVNSRFVKSKIVRDAVYEGFSTNLMVGRHPVFCLFVDIDPEIIDVNVHPTKIEIRFEDELEIFEFVKKSILDVFLKEDSIKNFEEKKERNLKLSEVASEIVDVEPVRKVAEVKSEKYFSSDYQKSLEPDVSDVGFSGDVEVSEEEVGVSERVESSTGESVEVDLGVSENIVDVENRKGPLFDVLNEYRVLGLLHKTYIIVEGSSEMFLIDFHAAAEKIAFERMMKESSEGKVKVQMLLKPFIVKLSPSEMLFYEENKEVLDLGGFVSEEFGAGEIIVRGVPIGLKGFDENPEKIVDLLHSLGVDKKSKLSKEEKVEVLARRSCRSSIKAGYEMTLPEMKKLIEDLRRIDEPFNCPHGRPVMLKWSYYDLEKKFKRIV